VRYQSAASWIACRSWRPLAKLEEASIETLNAGIMTKDLVGLVEGMTPKAVTSIAFIREIRVRLAKKLA